VAAEHPNATAYRETAEAFRAGDMARIESLIDPDVVWHVPGTHRMAGEVRGRPALLEWLRDLSANGFWLTEDDVFGNDVHVCAVSVMGARRDGVDVQARVISVFRYQDGRQLERWIYPDDLAAWNEIFGPEVIGD
jgi:uncharacterized protein